ncbi:hypothetical protein HC752_09580 [Vibrio sp. S9_S30]|uniref:hypothetical protein n=1 Tax=Vibrio sp. S9_S30 TaxID=2720226 RepID=UPI001680F26C|nr:hypothetical protein [Vibrio sp. S9_S30]MBD1557191.1 hypothetical protein [Vibrio sp. S9_S30]
MLNKTVFSLAATALLTACGGGSTANTPEPKPTPTDQTITVIDGYLSNAAICVDRNQNGQCDADERLSTMTDDSGKITIDKNDLAYPIMAQVIAGQTQDSDTPGYLSHSYEMIASAGEKTITPFTTLANIHNMDMSALAASLHLPLSAMTGDYVAKKASNNESAKAHLFARAITQQFSEHLSDADANELLTKSGKLTAEIAKLVNEGKDLDSVDLDFDSDGKVKRKDKFQGLAKYLESGRFWVTTLNNNDYLLQTASFAKGKMNGSLFGATDKPYQITGKSLTFTDTNTSMDFFYVSPEFALSFSSINHMPMIWSKQDFVSGVEANLKASDLIGQRWYHLRDIIDVDQHARLQLIELHFKDAQTVTVKPYKEEAFDASWTFTEDTHDNGAARQTVALSFTDNAQHDSLNREGALTLVTQLQSQHMILVDNTSSQLRADNLLIRNKNFARFIYEEWERNTALPIEDLHAYLTKRRMFINEFRNMTGTLYHNIFFRDGNQLSTNYCEGESGCQNTPYTLTNQTLDFDQYQFEFVDTNTTYLLSFDKNDELAIWTSQQYWETSKNIDDSFVKGNTFYHLRDTTVHSTTPVLTTLVFSDNNTVTVTPEGETGFTATWTVTDWKDIHQNEYRVIDIVFPDGETSRPSLRNENGMKLEILLSTPNLALTYNHMSTALNRDDMLFSNEALARSIYTRWGKSSL